MNRAKVILVGCFLVALAAGASLGLLIARSWLERPAPCKLATPSTSRPDPARHRFGLGELNLTAKQREQIEKIRSDTHTGFFKRQSERRKAATSQRDQEIHALLSDAQRVEYEAIQQRYARQLEEISQEWERVAQDGIAQIKKILTPEQAARYDELMKRAGQRGGPGMSSGFRGHHGGPGQPGQPGSRPTTDEHSPPRGRG